MKRSIEFRILVLVVAVLLLPAGVSFLAVSYVRQDLDHLARERALGFSALAASSVERTMLLGGVDASALRFDRAELPPAVLAIEVFNHQGRDAFTKDAEVHHREPLAAVLASRAVQVDTQGDRLEIFRPLLNKPACLRCHPGELPVLGVVHVAVSLADEQERVRTTGAILGLGSLGTLVVLGLLLLLALRVVVIRPLRGLQDAAGRLARGDLRFTVPGDAALEIETLHRSMDGALRSLAGMLRRVLGLAGGARRLADSVESNTRLAQANAAREAADLEEIAASANEARVAAAAIAKDAGSLALSARTTAQRVEELAAGLATSQEGVKGLTEAVYSTGSAAEELSASQAELAAGASQLSALVAQTLPMMDPIIAAVGDVSLAAEQSAQLTGNVMERAQRDGLAAMDRVMSGMARIRESVELTAAALDQFLERSREIDQVVATIESVAGQTGLLALNASIQAAQASEGGRGFAVVAHAVKALSVRTGASSREIAALVERVKEDTTTAVAAMDGARTAVSEGMDLTAAAGDVLRGLLEQTRRSADVARTIARTTAHQVDAGRKASTNLAAVRDQVLRMASATAEQATGLRQVRDAAERMRTAAQQAADGLDRQNRSGEVITAASVANREASTRVAAHASQQELDTARIEAALVRLRGMPASNRRLLERTSDSVRDLVRELETLKGQVERLHLPEEAGEGGHAHAGTNGLGARSGPHAEPGE